MRKKVGKQLGRAARAAGRKALKSKGKVGLAAAGVALVAGAVVLAKKQRTRRKRNDASGALAGAPDMQADGVGDSAEAAMHIPVVTEADAGGRGSSRKGSMTSAPVAGARYNDVRDDRKEPRD